MQPPHTDHDLTELVVSRISHDLFNPLGAILNGVELLELSGPSPELDLVKTSIACASNRLKLMRNAFGSATARESMSAREATQMFVELSKLSRHQFSLQSESAIPATSFKTLCLAALVGEQALTYGGKVQLQYSERGSRLIGEGRNVKFDTAPAPHSPTSVHLISFLDETRGRLSVEHTETCLTLKF